MVPPGYGLSDLALIIKIADRIYDAYKNSPGEFQALARDAETLKSTVKDFRARFPDDGHNGNGESQPAKLILESKEVLEKLEARLEKYKSLATDKKSTVDRLRFDDGELRRLRERMRTLASSIQGLRVEVILQQSDSIRFVYSPQCFVAYSDWLLRCSNQVAQILDNVVRDKISDSTLGSTPWRDFFDEIYVRLEQRDISLEDMKGNKHLIVDSIVKGVEKQKSTLPQNPPATQSNTLARQDYQESEQLDGTTLREPEFSSDNTSRFPGYPWDEPDLTAIESTLVALADEGAELKASILQAVTKRISLRKVGSSSVAHDGLPPDPPSASVREASKLFDSGAFRPAGVGADVISGERKVSTSSVRQIDQEVMTKTNAGSPLAWKHPSPPVIPKKSKRGFGAFLSGIGQSARSATEG